MIRYFSSSHPLNILLLFFLGIVIRIPFFLSPVELSENVPSGQLYSVLNDNVFYYLKSYPILSPSIAYLIIFIQGLSMNGFINSQKLFPTPHLLFLLSYLIFTSVLPEWNMLSPQLLSGIIITIMIQKIMLTFHKSHVANDLLILSFLAGVAGLLYSPAICLIFLVFLGVLIFRSFRPADWIVVTFGVLLPYYLLLSYLFIFDFWALAKNLTPSFDVRFPVFFQKSEDILKFALIILPLISGFFYARKNAIRMVVLPRKGWVFVSASLLVSICSFFTGIHNLFDALYLAMIPVSFFVTAFFYYPAVKFFPSLYLWLMLGFLVVNNFL